MFLDGPSSDEFELTQKIPDYIQQLNSTSLSIKAVDLNSYCTKKQKLIISSPVSLGKRKDKIKIKCYTCEK